MEKFINFFRRLRDSSLKRMFMHINKMHEESSASRIYLFFDIIHCIFKYSVGYLDYHVFGFAFIKDSKQRESFLTMNKNLDLIKQNNDERFFPLFNDKAAFLTMYRQFAKRDYIDLRRASAETFRRFMIKYSVAFAKPVSNFGGEGIRRIVFDEITDINYTYKELKSNSIFLVEQAITQHRIMDALNSSSINTLRIVTFFYGDVPKVVYTLIRIGRSGSCVDNICNGGMYAPVSEQGVIFRPAFCDETGDYYDIHPDTNTRIVGFKVPFYKEATDMVLKASLVTPQVRYVGWDVAITPSGPVLVEGNDSPAYDMAQNYRHLPDDKTGLAHKFGM